MELQIDKLKFMKACLESEKAALEFFNKTGLGSPGFAKKQKDKIAWMEQEITEREKGQENAL